MKIEQTPSPNFNDRKAPLDMLVLHYTGMESGEAALARSDTDLNSCSVGIEIVNGGHNVPLADGSLPPYSEAQIDAVIELSKAIVARHAIAQSRIVGHSDIAPARKEDPGEHFPWARLAGAGIGLWPEIAEKLDGAPLLIGRGLGRGDNGPPVRRLQDMLARIGYGLNASEHYDAATEATVLAFQRRWMPDRLTGQTDMETLRMIMAMKILIEDVHGANHI